MTPLTKLIMNAMKCTQVLQKTGMPAEWKLAQTVWESVTDVIDDLVITVQDTADSPVVIPLDADMMQDML